MKTNEEMQNDTRKSYVQHALIGALYGFLIGTAFVLVGAFVNIWLYPSLPLGVDWEQTLVRWLLIGLGLTLIGALTSLFTETVHGLAAGAIAASLLTLTAALYVSSTSTGTKFLVLIIILIPIAVMSLPIVWLLRRLTYQHELSVTMQLSVLRITLLILAAIAIGALGGFFTRMSRDALVAVQTLHEHIQVASQNPDSKVGRTAGFEEHSGMKYVLFQKRSTTSTVGFDVRAEYEDGYTIQCSVVPYPGRPAYLGSCEELQ